MVARGFEEKLLNGILQLSMETFFLHIWKKKGSIWSQSFPKSSSDIKGFDLCAPLHLITRNQYCHWEQKQEIINGMDLILNTRALKANYLCPPHQDNS